MSSGTEKILINITKNQWVGVGIVGLVVVTGLYFLIKKIGSDTSTALGKGAKWLGDHTGISAAGDAISTALSSVSDSQTDPATDTLSSWYDPTSRSVFFYYVTFPDGNSHYVGASSVGTDGVFTYSDGNSYRLGNSKFGDIRAYPWTAALPPDLGINPNSWGGNG